MDDVKNLVSKTVETFGQLDILINNAGDLGCVSAFLLYATKFDFKRFKYLWAVLASLILTFSLAGYLLALFGYSAIMMTKNKFSSKKLLQQKTPIHQLQWEQLECFVLTDL